MLRRLSLALFVTVLITTFQATAQQGDPWIHQAYKELYNRSPNAWELIIYNYKEGRWNNYGELKKAVEEYQNSMRSRNIITATASAGKDRTTVVFAQNGKAIGVDLVKNGGGGIIAAGGGNLVAAGGGNLVAAGGGNLVAAGGGNLVAAGGGNITVSLPPNFQVKDLAGASFSNTSVKHLQTAVVVKTSGNGTLVFK